MKPALTWEAKLLEDGGPALDVALYLRVAWGGVPGRRHAPCGLMRCRRTGRRGRPSSSSLPPSSRPSAAASCCCAWSAGRMRLLPAAAAAAGWDGGQRCRASRMTGEATMRCPRVTSDSQPRGDGAPVWARRAGRRGEPAARRGGPVMLVTPSYAQLFGPVRVATRLSGHRRDRREAARLTIPSATLRVVAFLQRLG
jgi:hypothetical protein